MNKVNRKLTSYNGDDNIYTPIEMAKAIVDKLGNVIGISRKLSKFVKGINK